VEGYEAPEAILSVEAAAALKAVERDLRARGYALKIFDAYRPQRAVRHFARWARDLQDTANKARFYPDVDKAELFARGYIAEKSGHTRGSAIDVTLVEAESGREVDMGSFFDRFGRVSHHGALVAPAQAARREILRRAMTAHGFAPLQAEWWHYRLKNEPYPGVYFDFPVAAPPEADAATQRMLEARAGGADRMVTAFAAGAGDRAVVRAYLKRGGLWTLRFTTEGFFGRNGVTADKREGDGATPAGVFTFGTAFGIAPDPGAVRPYRQADTLDVWVDDPASKHYNQWARTDFPAADWKSAERIAAYGKAYKYAIAIDYNVDPVVPGKGSAIFLHVETGGPTAGCIAVPEAAMVFFLSFARPGTRIVIARG
jgi:D-alanyl-D-alanine dipeptidase